MPERYHLVGAAGVGMSALAQALLGAGYDVSGSDRFHDRGQDADVVSKLRGAGVRFVSQDGRGVTASTAGVVVSTAIEPGNPDLSAAERLGVPVLHRAEMLARLAGGKRCVAVTGTSGKSTVTGMIGWILECCGADPVVVNGAPVLNWMTPQALGNVRLGRSDLWVIEADESDRSLLMFHPEWAVITNVSKDHFELREAEALFRQFRSQVKTGVVGPIGDRRTARDFKAEATEGGSRFLYEGHVFDVPLPGLHNAENAYLAAMLCERLGMRLDAIRGAIASFRGIHRRLETVGEARGVRVVDDYAHNPAKIHAAWLALAHAAPRVIGVWRPHGFGPLALMMDELAEAFVRVGRVQDRLFLLPVYDAGGTADRSVRSETLADKLRDAGVSAAMASGFDEVVGKVVRMAARGDVVLVMGARDPDLPALARRILAAIEAG